MNGVSVGLGIDCLLDEHLGLIQGARIGLVSNASGVTGDLRRTVDALFDMLGTQLTALFAPEHGFATDVSDGVTVGMMREAAYPSTHLQSLWRCQATDR